MNYHVLFRFFLLVLIGIYYISCSNPQSTKEPNSTKERNSTIVNLDNAQSKDTLKLSQIFNKAQIVFLDSCSEALIGNIDQMAMTDTYIFILDKRVAKRILMFNKQGKFIRTIGSSGSGKGEYFSPTDFALDKKQKQIFVLDRQTRRIHQFNYTTGKHISSIDIPHMSNHLLYNSNTLYMDCPQKGKTHLIWEVSTNGKETSYLLSPQIHNKGWDSALANQDGIFLSKYANVPKLTHLFMDTVFCIENHKIYPYLVLQSKDMMAEKDLKNLNIDENPMQLIDLFQKDKYFNMQTYMEKENFIFFQMQRKSQVYSFYYDKTAKQLNKYKLLYEDMLSDGMEFRLMGLRFGSSDDKGVCFYLSPNRVNMLKQMKGVKLNIDKEENFNGVIFYYTYKE